MSTRAQGAVIIDSLANEATTLDSRPNLAARAMQPAPASATKQFRSVARTFS